MMDAEEDPFGPLPDDAVAGYDHGVPAHGYRYAGAGRAAARRGHTAPNLRHGRADLGVWDQSGAPMLTVARFNLPKRRRRKAQGGAASDVHERNAKRWRFGVPGSGRPLYGLDRLANEPDLPVLVVEGEKSADAALSCFRVMWPSPRKAARWQQAKADWSPLHGRQVVVWPDQDEPGRTYARHVAKLATAAGAEMLGIVSVPQNWPQGWDVADTPPEGVSPDALADMVASARPADGERRAVLTPAQCGIGDPRPYVIKGLIARGDHGQFIGQPGSGKSAVAPYAGYCIAVGMPFFGRRVRQGRVLYLAAEDGHGMKLRVRALCKRFGDTSDFLLGPESLNLMDPASATWNGCCG